ncbi:toll/interleukin-1 receptor domain-containing protein [Frankia sp. AgB32]|uniref:toll/interleukin-1 receptor domain-containing protein n=1 Tax=Frankia sp. AgB32 TaxID=631119 RepID=UPI0034D453BB
MNWTVGMQNGITRARHTVAVLSDAYFRSTCGTAEWMAVRRADPEGLERSLIPVRIEACNRHPPGWNVERPDRAVEFRPRDALVVILPEQSGDRDRHGLDQKYGGPAMESSRTGGGRRPCRLRGGHESQSSPQPPGRPEREYSHHRAAATAAVRKSCRREHLSTGGSVAMRSVHSPGPRRPAPR